MVAKLPAAIMIDDDIMRRSVQPGFKASIGSLSLFQSGQKAIKNIRCQIARRLHILYLTGNIAVDERLVFVVDFG